MSTHLVLFYPEVRELNIMFIFNFFVAFILYAYNPIEYIKFLNRSFGPIHGTLTVTTILD